MSREVIQLAKILSDPENANRSAEEVADLVLKKMYDLAVSTAKAEIRAETRSEIRKQIAERDAAVRRLAVVGQISFGPQEPTHTVVLGPFYAPQLVDTEEQFNAAVAKPCTPAREAGQNLAWDARSGTGRGRFLLAPVFNTPRQAWDFYRGQKAAPVIAQALADIPPKTIKPVCLCGLRDDVVCHAHPAGR
ncbi:hypothetical protein AB0E62_00510 [Streptomyces sp. NPDC038707]|uniref:hypothetical protein n=1 Tax=Streptomyces sp. NPDC038707 TaxID=3154329 RepID=UPI0033FBD32B